jgi:putative transposase
MVVDAPSITSSSSGFGAPVKYEDIYLKGYATVRALESGLADYFQFCNYQRPHQSLDYRVPADV